MTSAAAPQVREMTLADVDRVSEIRVRGWQWAYRGLMPQSYLDALSVAEDAERRRAGFGRGGPGVVNLVAERAGTVVGWAALGPYREGEVLTEEAELYALYAAVEHIGTGVGRALLQEAARRAEALGHPAMRLWVLEGNAPARRFYTRAGLHADGAEEPFEVAGVTVSEVRHGGRLPLEGSFPTAL
ncbi:N-acetyltransferase [Streptomyces humidus]|uniref:N-acetyltransferase n=1 Tax=Streptomyces humidus TaxID=52259 RepID=A0A918FYX4_9ACTN|nr:GNAT family N-acetyltransferase [Streptomyces humidus]GGS03415.1 N-acetyltransferase [Streptomyces humidus]